MSGAKSILEDVYHCVSVLNHGAVDFATTERSPLDATSAVEARSPITLVDSVDVEPAPPENQGERQGVLSIILDAR